MYNAFISYSHTADDKFAPALQVALQKFAKPWYKKRNLEIFCDESSLAVSPHLWNNITKALDQSEHFILLASPASENSKWVNREIEYWLDHKSIDTLLIALTDGTIEWNNENNCFLNPDNNSLPPALDYKFDSEPFYIDLRFSRTEEDISLDNLIFKKEVLKLAAKLHGKQPNDLASEEVTIHRKMILLRNTAISILCIFLASAIVLALFANKMRIEANNKTEEAKNNATEASNNLKKFKLEEFERNFKNGIINMEAEVYSSAIDCFTDAKKTSTDSLCYSDISMEKRAYLDSVLKICKKSKPK
jgi:hypothetical protein